jgi:hypothetical protein
MGGRPCWRGPRANENSRDGTASMRVALFVVVVAAHVLLWLLLPSWRYPSRESAEESSIAPIFLPPLLPEPATLPESSTLPEAPPTPSSSPWQAPLIYRSASGSATSPPSSESPPWQTAAPERRSSGEPDEVNQPPADEQSDLQPQFQQQALAAPAPTAPDWHAQAELTAQADAERIVAAEDAAQRRANALTAHFKPMAPPLVRSGPEFGWSVAAHRWEHIPGGGFAYALNDHCSILILIIPFIGCKIGKTEANGHLFDYMHKPVKFGDWDWRLDDP